MGAGLGIRDWGSGKATAFRRVRHRRRLAPTRYALPNPQSRIPNPGPAHALHPPRRRRNRHRRHRALRAARGGVRGAPRSEEHTSELQSLMRISYAVFCLKKKKKATYPITQIKKKLLYTEAYTQIYT